jgi:hypothetical protein
MLYHQLPKGPVVLALALSVSVGATAARATEPVTAAVLRSQGTQNLGMTIWREPNAGWSAYGDTQVEIDYSSLAVNPITPQALAATNADVLIISMAGTAFEYSDAEAAAITDYVQAGHGLIVTYASIAKFLLHSPPRNQDLIPLLGMSETLSVGTSSWSDPLVFDLLVPQHPIFTGVNDLYMTGVPFTVVQLLGTQWDLTTGIPLAQFTRDFNDLTHHSLIVANETDEYRSVYFPHYIEDKGAGTNEQDMQVFYNSLIWTSAVPEPGTIVLLGTAVAGIWSSRRRRRTIEERQQLLK